MCIRILFANSLTYDLSKKGMTLASGSADSDIYVWDLVSNTAVLKLKGHKDAVTGLAFLKKGLNQFIISVSKDTQMKKFTKNLSQ